VIQKSFRARYDIVNRVIIRLYYETERRGIQHIKSKCLDNITKLRLGPECLIVWRLNKGAKQLGRCQFFNSRRLTLINQRHCGIIRYRGRIL